MNIANGFQSLLNLTFFTFCTLFSMKSKLHPLRKQEKIIFRELLFQFGIFHHPFGYLKAQRLKYKQTVTLPYVLLHVHNLVSHTAGRPQIGVISEQSAEKKYLDVTDRK